MSADRLPARATVPSLSITDSLSGAPSPVVPGPGGRVNLYVCGPTVYSAAHVGHARTFLYFDIARRILEADGQKVRHVMNITDVEDKIDRRAQALGIGSIPLARIEERRFFDDMGALGVRPPHFRPRAGDYVPQMVRVGRALEKTGRVQRTGDEWIYEAPDRPKGENFPTGEELARHVVPEPGFTFGGRSGRERAILVWKRQDPPLPSWPSPWGPGVPGWHLECFAMTTELLGIPVDLHGGARDLVYPHHYSENEIALALRGSRFSRTFLHAGFVLQNGSKMAKSTGNLVALRAALDRVGAGALRWYLVGKAFADRLPWEERDLDRAVAEFRAVRRAIDAWLRPGAGGSVGAAVAEAAAQDVRRALADNLGTDRAIARIAELVRTLGSSPNARAPRGERPGVRAAVRAIEERTGLPLLRG